MQAVIKAGSKQHIVDLGQTLEIDLVPGESKSLEFEPLLVIDGDTVTVGTPAVAGTKVTAEILGDVKGDKINVLKFKAKKRVNTRTGHRQRYTQIRITGIGSAKAKAEDKADKPAAAAAGKDAS